MKINRMELTSITSKQVIFFLHILYIMLLFQLNIFICNLNFRLFNFLRIYFHGSLFLEIILIKNTKFKALKIISTNKVSTCMQTLWGTT